eukprot:69595_1
MNINLIKCDGTIDLWLLSEKAGFCMTSGFCIRGAELHNGNDEDLVIGVDEDGYQMMDLTIYHDKTRSTSFHKVIYCAEDGMNDENLPPVIYDGFSMSSSYYLGGDNGDNGIKQEK